MSHDRRLIAMLPSLLCLLIPGLLLPLLEVNATHLFHPEWPPHARLHEAWQLITNGVLAWGALAIALNTPHSRIPHAIGLTISTSFVVAWLLRNYYGGSMGDATTANLAIAGIDVAVLVMGIASVFHFIGFSSRESKKIKGGSISNSGKLAR